MKRKKGKGLRLLMILMLIAGLLPTERIQAAGAGGIEFQIEGDAWTSYEGMKAQDSSFEIYVKPDGDADYVTFQELLDQGRIIKHSDSQYEFDSSITSIRVYITMNTDKYMLMSGIGIGEEHATTIDIASGTQFIQLDKKSVTVTWSYEKDKLGEDAFLEHGKAEIIAIEGISDFRDIPFANNPGDDKGGHIAVEPGRKVTVKLTPDYGYQLKSVALNGTTLVPDDDNMSVFTFRMPDTNVHFQGIFEKTADTISLKESGSTVKNISIENGYNAAASGTLQMDVTDNHSYDTKEAQKLVEGAISAKAVDFTLNQVVSKGNGENWEKNITEFEKPITLKLALDDYDPNMEYEIVRNHEGILTVLDTTVENGTISFDTNQFSTYVIVAKNKGKDKENNTPLQSGTNEPSDTSANVSPAAQNSTPVNNIPTQNGTPVSSNAKAVSPVTGDDMPVHIYMVLVVCMVAFGVINIRRKKNHSV